MKTYDKDNQYLDFYTFADSSCMEYVYGSNNIYNVIDNDYCDYVRKESNYQRNTRYLLEVADTNRYNRYNFKPIINQGKRSHSIYHILTNAYEYWIVGKDTNMVEYEYYMLSDNKVSQYEIYEMHRKYRKSLKTYKNNELNGSYIEYYPYNDRFSSNNQLNRQDRLDPNNRIDNASSESIANAIIIGYTDCNATSIAVELNGPDRINIYPNPATDNIYISNLIENAILKIYDINGKLVLENKVSDKEDLNISTLSKGMYQIKFEGKDWSETRKLIKE